MEVFRCVCFPATSGRQLPDASGCFPPNADGKAGCEVPETGRRASLLRPDMTAPDPKRSFHTLQSTAFGFRSRSSPACERLGQSPYRQIALVEPDIIFRWPVVLIAQCTV